MKKYLYLSLTFLTLVAPKAFCAVETVSPELEKSLKTHSGEPGILSVIFALFVVIGLIYITGIIYSKLNIVGANTIKKQLKNYDLNKAIVLSTTQLGQNKNLHVIEIDNQRLLIGAASESITLIKELSSLPKKENEEIIAEDENKNEIETNTEISEEKSAENDVYKKYL